ncbi:hypothetical protein CEXT_520321 [Caerostris extrusa]|uniref:Uncharacterized protein n=1 Tax=Caerostris extrusa TaxID=172846 RepID=A0AAV4PLA7_CAEEX|nr:hypothetical protein CEXT_520321 [Caerostris extrusa]
MNLYEIIRCRFEIRGRYNIDRSRFEIKGRYNIIEVVGDLYKNGRGRFKYDIAIYRYNIARGLFKIRSLYEIDRCRSEISNTILLEIVRDQWCTGI